MEVGITTFIIPAWVWVVAGIVLIAVELAAPGYLFFLSLGLAAVAAGLLQMMGLTSGWQETTAVFVVASLASLIPLWKLGRRLREQAFVPSNVDALVGRQGRIIGPLGPAEAPINYLVQVDSEQWSARSAKPGLKLGAGQSVRVVKVDGVTLIVEGV